MRFVLCYICFCFEISNLSRNKFKYSYRPLWLPFPTAQTVQGSAVMYTSVKTEVKTHTAIGM